MVFPSAIQGALASVVLDTLPGCLAIEPLVCAGAKYHSPTPLMLHEVEIDGHLVLLCGTCRGNVSVLTALLSAHENDLEWPIRRAFGNQLRALLIPKEGTNG